MGSHFDATAQVSYYSFGIRPEVTPGETSGSIGRAHVFSAGLDPRFHVTSTGRFDPYIVAEVGYYRRSVGIFRRSASNT